MAVQLQDRIIIFDQYNLCHDAEDIDFFENKVNTFLINMTDEIEVVKIDFLIDKNNYRQVFIHYKQL